MSALAGNSGRSPRAWDHQCVTQSSPSAATSFGEAELNQAPWYPRIYLCFDRMKPSTGRLTVSSSVLKELPADP
jgi:hypothetical protein